ncbi:MAG: PAS domain S-box protein [Deltaproteobacteria bacterium]|nr:PAS domain S-box protein [Deltaproteobacteria bacterium]
MPSESKFEPVISLNKLKNLIKVSKEVLSETTMDGLLKKIIEGACDVIESRIGTSHYGYGGNAFDVNIFVAGENISPCPLGKVFHAEKGGIYLDLIERRKSFRFSDAEMRRHPKWWGLPSGHVSLRGLVGARLVGREGEPNGLIMLSDKKRGDFTEEDETLLIQLAAMASLGLQHIQSCLEAEEHRGILKALMKYIPEGIAIADAPDVNIRLISDFGMNMLEMDEKRLKTTSANERSDHLSMMRPGSLLIAKGEDVPMTRAVLQGEVIMEEEWILQRRDGKKLTISANAGPIRNQEGAITGGVVTWRDISFFKMSQDLLKQARNEMEIRVKERTAELEAVNQRLKNEIERHKKTSQDLAQNTELLETVFATTHFMIAYMDKDFYFIKVNQAYADMAGHSPDFFVGKNHFDLYPHPENEDIFRRVCETGAPYNALEKPFVYPDHPDWGITYWDWSLHPVKDDAGKVMGLVLGLVDVTDRKVAQNALQESERKYRELQENSLDGFVRTSMKGIFIEFNRVFTDMLGYTDEELHQCTYQEIMPEKWHHMEAAMIRMLLKDGYTPLYEKEYIRKDGTVFPIEIRSYLTRDQNGQPLEKWAFIRDITDRKRTEEQLDMYLKRLEESNKELQEFAFVTSHDLHEPLRKIQTFGTQLLDKHAENLDRQGLDYLTRMVNASTRMRTLIDALLNYSRLSTREMPYESVSLMEVMNVVLSNLETRIKETDALIDVGELPVIEADRQQMIQLLQNLIGNALKFSKEDVPPIIKVYSKHIKPKKAQRRKHDTPRESWEVYVEDNGIGFDEKYVSRIFQPFQRLHGRSEYDGVGMGLAICRKIIERHQGMIKAKSARGKGSVFVITLPVKQPDQEETV